MPSQPDGLWQLVLAGDLKDAVGTYDNGAYGGLAGPAPKFAPQDRADRLDRVAVAFLFR